MTYTVPSLKRARPGEEEMADNLKRKQFIEDIRSVKKALAALTEKWHAWEEALQ
jgi:hypothetical protein